jgi:mRNA interferase RelE/StbE
MQYKVDVENRAAKVLSKIDEPVYSRIKAIILNLAYNPRPMGCIKLKGRDAYRIRTGDYRIIYEIIDNRLIINIITIGHRKDIYKNN